MRHGDATRRADRSLAPAKPQLRAKHAASPAATDGLDQGGACRLTITADPLWPIFEVPQASAERRCRGSCLVFAALLPVVRRSAPRCPGLEPRRALRRIGRSRSRPTSGIEWQQDAQAYIARGNAIGKARNDRGTRRHADRALPPSMQGRRAAKPRSTASMPTAMSRSKARRRPSSATKPSTMSTSRSGIVTGKALKLTTTTDVVTARDSLEWYDQKQIAVARGDAVAVRENVKRSVPTPDRAYDKGQDDRGRDQVRSTAGKSCTARRQRPSREHRRDRSAASEGSRISRVDAQGNVMVSTATDIGRGDFGVYNADTGHRHAARQCHDHARPQCDQRSIRRRRSEQQCQPHDAGCRQARVPHQRASRASSFARNRQPAPAPPPHPRGSAQKP